MMLFPCYEDCTDLPPKLYDLMRSIAHKYYPAESISTASLPGKVKSYIFDFNYPYPSAITEDYSKDKFEEMLLKHFMLRRINYETFTAFKIMLEQKLYSIMPKYQLMLNNTMLEYNLAANTTTTTADNTSVNNGSISINTSDSGTSTSSGTNGTTGSTTTKDTDKYSDTPQGLLSNVEDDRYLTDYRVKDGSANTSTTTTASDTSTTTNTGSSTNTNSNTTIDDINQTVISNRNINELIEFQEKFMAAWEMIFNDCESLFYGIEV